MFFIRLQLNMILDASNKKMLKFIFLYGILRSIILAFLISMLIKLFHFNDMYILNTWMDMMIKVTLSIIPGIFIGIGEYIMYNEAIEGINVKKKVVKYVSIEGIFGWGLLCSILTSIFYPFDIRNIIFPFILLPGYALVIEDLILIMFNQEFVKNIYNSKIKGKNIIKIIKK